MTDRFVWWNGAVMPPEEARLDPRDRAVLYGVGLFETLRSYRGFPFGLDAHLRRMRATATKLRLDVSFPPRRARAAIAELLAACELDRQDASVRITVTGGLDGGGIDRPAASPPSILIHARATARLAAPAAIRVCRAGDDAHRPIPGIKSIGYLPSALARLAARERGCDEALVMTEANEVLEAANSTILARLGNTLVTPPLDGRILPSVTRRIVLDLAGRMDIAVDERPLHWHELANARELLAIGSVREISAIVAVDGRRVADGRPGPWSRKLFRAYRREVAAAAGAG